MGDRAIAEAITEEEGRALSCISLTRSWQGIGTEMRASLIRRGLVKDDGNTLLLSSEAEDAVSLYPLLGREGKAETYPGSFHEMLLSGSGQIKEMEEAAIVDGCGFFQTYVRIMFPLAKPIIVTVVIMQFIWTWNSFLMPLVLTLSQPSLRTLAVGLYALQGEHVVDWTGIAAGATISVLPVILVFIAMQKHFVNGIAGAVKS